LIEKGFLCNQKKGPKQKGKKKENAKGGKREPKKSLLNAAEIGVALVQDMTELLFATLMLLGG